MSGKQMSAKWMVLIWFGVTAAVIFMPLNRPRTGVGVGSATAALSGTYTQHCIGYLVSSIDGLSKCVAPSPCPAAKSPELDFLDTIGVMTVSGSSVTGNSESDSLSNNSPVSSDAQYHNAFGITETGMVTYGGAGVPTGCFTINLSGSVTAGPTTICFKASSQGCPSFGGMHYATDDTLTALGIASPTCSSPATKFTASPIELQCVGEKQ